MDDRTSSEINALMQQAREAGWDDAMEEASGTISQLSFQNGLMRSALESARRLIADGIGNGVGVLPADVEASARRTLAEIDTALDPQFGPPGHRTDHAG